MPPTYPDTRRDEHVVDTLHGVEVPDPYRWLEATDSVETRRWIEAQNALTESTLSACPAREQIRERVRAAWNHPRRRPPLRRGRRWFQLRNDGLQDQDVLWTAEAADEGSVAPPDDAWEVLLDPNLLSPDGTVALSDIAVSTDGGLLAYALSEAGSDWRTWHVREVATLEDLPDVIAWSKFAPAAWLPDASGFVYGAFDPPAAGEEYEAANRNMRLMLHRLGTGVDADEVVYERPDQPEWRFEPEVSHDGAWLVVTVAHGTATETRVHAARIADGDVGPVTPILDDGDAAYLVLGVVGDRLLVHTDLDAPNGRIVSVDPDAPDTLVEVVPAGEDRLRSAMVVGGAGPGAPGWIVASYLRHATSRVAVFDLDGTHVHDVDLPDLGTAGEHLPTGGFTGGRSDTSLHLSFETFTAPARILRHDLETGSTHEVTPPGLPDAPGLVTEQVMVPSGDVEVPLFLVHRDDVSPTGDVPTVLWGYGGFDIPITPHFRTAFRVWVELGGVLAVACLRGGGEYGRAWHDAGRLADKQHVFDDAIACAEWLTGPGGWTRPDRLGIEGRSNGGLLVGACITQRPDLFGSAVPEVGVLDMLRFHRFTIGWAWVSDYGCADDPEQFRWLWAYSPLHRVAAGTAYPPTLVTTGDHDDRVVPGHSFKFAAALQAAQAGEGPVLIRIDTSAGHGVGKPVSKLVDERTDVLTFHAAHLRLDIGSDPA